MDHAFGVASKTLLSYLRSSGFFFALLSSRVFIVLHFILRFIIYFKLIFVKDIKSVSRIIYLFVDVWLFQHHLLKISFLYYIDFGLLLKIKVNI